MDTPEVVVFEKVCPMRWVGLISRYGTSVLGGKLKEENCIGAKCAWWNADRGTCTFTGMVALV